MKLIVYVIVYEKNINLKHVEYVIYSLAHMALDPSLSVLLVSREGRTSQFIKTAFV